MPFLHAFSINHLFLFSEFVSWTMIDCLSLLLLREQLQSVTTWRADLGASKSRSFCFHVASDLPPGVEVGDEKEKIDKVPETL